MAKGLQLLQIRSGMPGMGHMTGWMGPIRPGRLCSGFAVLAPPGRDPNPAGAAPQGTVDVVMDTPRGTVAVTQVHRQRHRQGHRRRRGQRSQRR